MNPNASPQPTLAPELPAPTHPSDEAGTLDEMLDYYRVVLARKASGLDAAQLAVNVGASTITLGGLLHHLAFVEDYWFSHRFAGHDPVEPWASADWEADGDWDWHVADSLTPDSIMAQFDESVARSRLVLAHDPALDTHAAIGSSDGHPTQLRWIMVHMIEEYARHAGHADLLRESIDGVIGD